MRKKSKFMQGLTLSLAALLLSIGLVVPMASASATQIEICNSPESQVSPYIIVYYAPNNPETTGEPVYRNSCKVFTNNSNLRVDMTGAKNWRVRSVPGTYGSCQHLAVSNPGTLDKYSYKTYTSSSCTPI